MASSNSVENAIIHPSSNLSCPPAKWFYLSTHYYSLLRSDFPILNTYRTMIKSCKNHPCLSKFSQNILFSEQKQSRIYDNTMQMYFHGGFDQVVLFDFWKITSVFGSLIFHYRNSRNMKSFK